MYLRPFKREKEKSFSPTSAQEHNLHASLPMYARKSASYSIFAGMIVNILKIEQSEGEIIPCDALFSNLCDPHRCFLSYPMRPHD